MASNFNATASLGPTHDTEGSRRTREELLAAIRLDGHVLAYEAWHLKGDFEAVRCAVAQNGYALKHATDALRADRTVVLEAVRQNGNALAFASEALRADREVVRAAMSQVVTFPKIICSRHLSSVLNRSFLMAQH